MSVGHILDRNQPADVAEHDGAAVDPQVFAERSRRSSSCKLAQIEAERHHDRSLGAADMEPADDVLVLCRGDRHDAVGGARQDPLGPTHRPGHRRVKVTLEHMSVKRVHDETASAAAAGGVEG
jgi:hypothetical protein